MRPWIAATLTVVGALALIIVPLGWLVVVLIHRAPWRGERGAREFTVGAHRHAAHW
jgi:ABC-type Fe3+ transport system permease subunit